MGLGTHKAGQANMVGGNWAADNVKTMSTMKVKGQERGLRKNWVKRRTRR